MYISYIIEDFVTTVKEKLPEFHYLKKHFYDPNLDFDSRLRSYLVRIDVAEVEAGERDWIGICWNRGVIADAPELQDRKFEVIQRDLVNLTGKAYDVKFAKVPFSVAYFSNSLDYIEDFEETHYLEFNKLFTHKVLLPIFGWTEVAFTELSLGDVQKLDRDEKGTIVELSFSFNAIFPIAKAIKSKDSLPLIGEEIDPITGLPTGKPKIRTSIHFEVI